MACSCNAHPTTDRAIVGEDLIRAHVSEQEAACLLDETMDALAAQPEACMGRSACPAQCSLRHARRHLLQTYRPEFAQVKRAAHACAQIMENSALRKLVRARCEEILLVEHRRAHNICIELASLRMPHADIAVRARLPAALYLLCMPGIRHFVPIVVPLMCPRAAPRKSLPLW
jgi:hypothetical protein